MEWGKSGRIGIYTCNFGAACHWDQQASSLSSLQTVIVAVQEADDRLQEHMVAKGWQVSDPAYCGAGRSAGTPGLLICGAHSVKTITTHREYSGDLGGTAARSSHVTCTLQFRWGMAGVGDITVLNFHLHRDTARRGLQSPVFQSWCREVARCIRACGVRVLVGDANMSLFILTAGLAAQNISANLVAHHAEMATNAPVNLMDDRGVRKALRYDSCGVWLVGGVLSVRSLSLASQCLVGSLHPALLERRQGRYVCVVRGYEKTSYMQPPEGSSEASRLEELPGEAILSQVIHNWKLHGLKKLPHKDSWQWMVDVRAESGNTWQEVAMALPKSGEQLGALLEGLRSGVTRYDWTAACRQDPGDDFLRASGDMTGHVTEILANFSFWDDTGKVWGGHGHYPLWVMLGSARFKSVEGQKQQKIAGQQKNIGRRTTRRCGRGGSSTSRRKPIGCQGGPTKGVATAVAANKLDTHQQLYHTRQNTQGQAQQQESHILSVSRVLFFC